MSSNPEGPQTAGERLTVLLKALDRLVEDDRESALATAYGMVATKADLRRSEEARDRSRDAFEATLRGLVEECERMQRDTIRLDALIVLSARVTRDDDDYSVQWPEGLSTRATDAFPNPRDAIDRVVFLASSRLSEHPILSDGAALSSPARGEPTE